MGELPAGTITMLYSDIEGSTALLRRLGDLQAAYRPCVQNTHVGASHYETDVQPKPAPIGGSASVLCSASNYVR
jgi:hypothetical protein